MEVVSNIQRKFFWPECSTPNLPTLILRRTFRSITIWYNMPVVVIALKVRRNSPQCSNLAFKVRSIQKSHGWNRFWSRTLDVKDENLCYLFSSEKCPIAWKEVGHWKWCRTFSAKNLPWMFDAMALNPVFSFDVSAQLPATGWAYRL